MRLPPNPYACPDGSDPDGFKVADLADVRVYNGERAELCCFPSGRFVLRIVTEGGCSFVDVDLSDLTRWLRSGPLSAKGLFDGTGCGTAGDNPSRD